MSQSSWLPKSAGKNPWTKGDDPNDYNKTWAKLSPALCKHEPKMVLEALDKTWAIWSGRRYDVNDFSRFRIILNCTGTPLRQPMNRIPARFKSLAKYREIGRRFRDREILLDWDDMGLPPVRFGFWRALYQEIAKGGDMLVFCTGGHGRTGTALASLFVAAGYNAKQAIELVREIHCKNALETDGQEKYIGRLERYLRP